MNKRKLAKDLQNKNMNLPFQNGFQKEMIFKNGNFIGNQNKQTSDFDINLKIVSICKLETFKRDYA